MWLIVTEKIYINDLYSSVEFKVPNFKNQKKTIEKIVDETLEGKCLFNYSNQVLRTVPADSLRIISQDKRLADHELHRSSVISSVLSCESKCTGSGFLLLMLISGLNLEYYQQKHRVKIEDVKRVLDFYLGKGEISKNVLKIFNNHGFEYSLNFENSNHRDFSYVTEEALRVKGYLDPLFLDAGPFDKRAFIFCTEGKIESVGEIDRMLQWSMENNASAVIVSEAFSPDVCQTLRVNYGKKLDVLPFNVVPEEMNKLKLLGNPTVERDSGLRFSNLDYSAFNAFETHIKSDRLEISNVKGQHHKVNFLLPFSMVALHPLLTERVKQGISITKNTLLHGVVNVKLKERDLTFPKLCWDFAGRAFEEWKNLSKVACTVSLQQKNVYQNRLIQ